MGAKHPVSLVYIISRFLKIEPQKPYSYIFLHILTYSYIFLLSGFWTWLSYYLGSKPGLVLILVLNLVRLLSGFKTPFRYCLDSKPEMEFKEFEPRFKSAKIRKKNRFKFSAGLNLETFDTILSRTNHI